MLILLIANIHGCEACIAAKKIPGRWSLSRYFYVKGNKSYINRQHFSKPSAHKHIGLASIRHVRGQWSVICKLTLFVGRTSIRDSGQRDCVRRDRNWRRLVSTLPWNSGQFLCSRRHTCCSSTLCQKCRNWLGLWCDNFASWSGWSFPAHSITVCRNYLVLKCRVVCCSDDCGSISSHCFGLRSLNRCLCCSNACIPYRHYTIRTGTQDCFLRLNLFDTYHAQSNWGERHLRFYGFLSTAVHM